MKDNNWFYVELDETGNSVHIAIYSSAVPTEISGDLLRYVIGFTYGEGGYLKEQILKDSEFLEKIGFPGKMHVWGSKEDMLIVVEFKLV